MNNYTCPKPSCNSQRLNRMTGTIKYICLCCQDTYIKDDAGGITLKDPLVKSKKKPKYNNNRVNIDGIGFDSQLEADYYCQLRLRLGAEDIAGMSCQPRFLLTPATDEEQKSEYVADFIVFHNDGTCEVIDTKGMRTDKYIQKLKVFKQKYPNIRFREVKRDEVPRA